VPLLVGTPSKDASEKATYQQELVRMRHQVVKAMAERTGQPEAVVQADFDHGRSFNANQAKNYGLIDTIAD
jgi:ATP-dependent protease ClpP protease subunit